MEYMFARIASWKPDLPTHKTTRPYGAQILHFSRTHTLLITVIIRATPLSILTVDASGQGSVDNAAMLDTREKFFPLDVSRPYKLNAGSVGVCTLASLLLYAGS